MKFKKIMSVLASAVMLSSTVAFAAAASYPEPFVTGGTADAAVIVGANAAVSDYSAAIDIQQNLNSLVTTTTTSTSASTTGGESTALFTSGTKLWVNDPINTVKSALSESDLPTVLADGSFSGDVDATYTQTITLGNHSRMTFEKQPTSSDDPQYGYNMSSSSDKYVYDAKITFNKAVDFRNASSESQSIGLFGTSWTVGSASDYDTLVLLKSAEKVSLSSNDPTADVTVDGETYTVELVSASDTSATVAITDSTGDTESQEISEAASKKINGVTVAVTNADENNLKYSATVVVGSNKLTIENGASITAGEDDTVVQGTKAIITGGVYAMTALEIWVAAADSDEDAIIPGQAFVDPVFGTFKIDFAGLNIPEDSTSREDITIGIVDEQRMDITFTDHRDNTATINYIRCNNGTAASNWANPSCELKMDSDERNITVHEGGKVFKNEYVVVGNEDEGYLLKFDYISNGTTTNDVVRLSNVFDDSQYTASVTADGSGTINIEGRVYDISYYDASEGSSYDYINLSYPDGNKGTANTRVLYPTIETSKGAKVMLYEPLNVSLGNYSGLAGGVSVIKIPDGDGYTSVNIGTSADMGNFTVAGTELNASTGGTSVLVSTGELIWNFTYGGTNTTMIYLVDPHDGTGNIMEPAVIIFEEKDDNTVYEAVVVDTEVGITSDDGIGVNDIMSTWLNDSTSWESTMASDSKKVKQADLWGTISVLDKADSDQYTASISYPDEQIYGQIYVAEESAVITPGTTTSGSGGQILIVEDSAVSSVSGKNLVVVGGSCINTVAAKILGSDTPLCTSAFTDETQVGAGQYIIKTVASPYAAADSGKVAMLLAGYEAAETKLAVAKALEGVTADVDTSQVYPITTA